MTKKEKKLNDLLIDCAISGNGLFNEILEICKPKKDPEAIAKANITLTNLLNGLIKGDIFLEDFPEATILKLKILLTGAIDNFKPRKLSKEKFIKASKEVWAIIPVTSKDIAVMMDINVLIDEGKDIWEDK